MELKAANETLRKWFKEASVSPAFGGAPGELKKIIGGKSYNTETATVVATWETTSSPDYELIWEFLYQTRNGAFFLVGEGMANTPYGAVLPDCNDRIRGHVLLPLTESQVKCWLEMRELHDEYQEIFGEQEEAGDTNLSSHTMTLRLPSVLAQKVKALAGSESIQSFVQRAIETACAQGKGK